MAGSSTPGRKPAPEPAEQPAAEPTRKTPAFRRGSGSSLRRKEQADSTQPAPDVAAAGPSERFASLRRVPDRNWRLVAILGVVTVVFGIIAALAAFKPGARVSNEAYVDTAKTEQVKAATENALKTLYSYDYEHIDGYPDKARQVITDDMRKKFDQTVGQTVAAVKQAQTKTDATVDPIGVTLLNGDRAELLVNLTVSATNKGVAQDSASGPIVVDMVKSGDNWVASNIVDR
ncbi:hypothetical protein FOS14_19030 [Skermania sp. ID1734]|uniref:hypothetical protein n=1 Tax=Skermania sp. ID1734 TaxID=2597516 RepID=UPI00117CB949|nr:hypothetical protein [Skermania sp. ID1734]TSD95085.1 hypothetical protein FOS14_19030 [Skermania sp. ID1734]